MLRAGAIDKATYKDRRADYRDARSLRAKLKGTRRAQMTAVIANLDALAANGLLTVSRLDPWFLTLRSNRKWWTTGPLLSYGQRIRFRGSRLVWQYYPGQGIQLQMLGSWGKANGCWGAKKDARPAQAASTSCCRSRASAPAASRGSTTSRSAAGSPPWASALSQGTALQALARASDRLADPSLLDVAHSAPADLPQAAADRSPHPDRRRRPLPHLLVRARSARAQRVRAVAERPVRPRDARSRQDGEGSCYDAGLPEAKRETPHYDTGAWSLYDGRLASRPRLPRAAARRARQACASAATSTGLLRPRARTSPQYLEQAAARAAPDPPVRGEAAGAAALLAVEESRPSG